LEWFDLDQFLTPEGQKEILPGRQAVDYCTYRSQGDAEVQVTMENARLFQYSGRCFMGPVDHDRYGPMLNEIPSLYNRSFCSWKIAGIISFSG
jgi:hypothetical protein